MAAHFAQGLSGEEDVLWQKLLTPLETATAIEIL